MRCPKCNAETEADERFCRKCGQPSNISLNSSADEPAAERKTPDVAAKSNSTKILGADFAHPAGPVKMVEPLPTGDEHSTGTARQRGRKSPIRRLFITSIVLQIVLLLATLTFGVVIWKRTTPQAMPPQLSLRAMVEFVKESANRQLILEKLERDIADRQRTKDEQDEDIAKRDNVIADQNIEINQLDERLAMAKGEYNRLQEQITIAKRERNAINTEIAEGKRKRRKDAQMTAKTRDKQKRRVDELTSQIKRLERQKAQKENSVKDLERQLAVNKKANYGGRNRRGLQRS